MHSSSPGNFPHGPWWFRHYGPKIIPLLTVGTLVVILAGVFRSGEPEHIASVNHEATAAAGTGAGRIARMCESAYETVRVFLFHAEPQRDGLRGPLLHVGAFLAVLTAVLVGLGLLFVIWDHLRLWGLSFTRGRHVVICGLGERIGIPLARAYRTGPKADRRKVIAITWEPDAVHRRYSIETLCDLGGVIVLPGDATDLGLLKTANVSGAERVFAVTSDDAKNLEIAAAVARAGGRKPCVVHLAEQAWLRDRVQSQLGLAGLEIFSQRQQETRTLVRRLFAERAPRPGQNVHVVLLGFGPMGQAVARELVAQAHFLNHRRLRLTVTEVGIRKPRNAFLENYPTFCAVSGSRSFDDWDARLDDWDSLRHRPEVGPCAEARSPDEAAAAAAPAVEYACNAEFLEMPDATGVGGGIFVEKLRARLARAEVGAVVVCTEDAARNAEIALALEDALAGPNDCPVHVWLPKGEALARLLAPGKSGRTRIVPFGLLGHAAENGKSEALLSPQEIVEVPFEQEARAAHAAYLAQCQASGKFDPTDESMRSWEELPARTRDENRSQVANAVMKFEALRAIGITTEPSANPPEEAEQATAEEIEALAEQEHNRWMADKLMHGFRYSPVMDKPAHLHSLLVPFAALPEEEKEKDRDPIRKLLAGRSIIRRQPETET